MRLILIKIRGIVFQKNGCNDFCYIFDVRKASCFAVFF